jgi:hypothetical protein
MLHVSAKPVIQQLGSLTELEAPRVSGSGEGSAEKLPAYPITSGNLQMVNRNNSGIRYSAERVVEESSHYCDVLADGEIPA